MGGLRLGQVRGIELRIDLSVVLVAALIAWSLAETVLPGAAPGRSTPAYWTAAAVTAVAFFGALLAHELGHSVVAQQHGVVVSSITLWLLGGMARLASDPPDARAAFRIAAAGPAVSAAIGALALGFGLPADGLVGGALVWFGAINLALAAFNLVPAFPLDGGRIHQAWHWHRTGDGLRATESAVRLGRAIGAGFLLLGGVQALAGSVVGGVWLALIGWFVRDAGSAELRHARLAGPLRSLAARDVMTADLRCAPADLPVDQLVEFAITNGRHSVYPVVEQGRVIGMVDVVARRARPAEATTVRGVMTPLADIARVEPDDALVDVARRVEGTRARALVCDGTDVVGIISPTDLARLVALLDGGASRSRPAVG